MSCDFIGVCVDVACVAKIYIDLALRMLGHVALLKCNLWTASVTDPLLHAGYSRVFMPRWAEPRGIQ